RWSQPRIARAAAVCCFARLIPACSATSADGSGSSESSWHGLASSKPPRNVVLGCRACRRSSRLPGLRDPRPVSRFFVPNGHGGSSGTRTNGHGVALLDLDQPGLSGPETLRGLRAMAAAPEVIVTTREGTADAAAAAARAGAFDFVPQPFNFKELSQIL